MHHFFRIAIPCFLAAILVMGAGWGIRGSFGHSRGAMLPGAMLGLALVACAGRNDWWKRGAIVGLLAGIGWAFGGASSYGMLVGYSLDAEATTSIYGYFALALVGGLYAGVGCGLLGIGLTKPRSFLENALWPMVITYVIWLILDWSGALDWSLEMFRKAPDKPSETKWLFDTLWIYALASVPIGGLAMLVPKWRGPATLMLLMAVGWWLSMASLIGVLGLRINPSRNDTWAGVLGVLLGLVAYIVWTRNRASLMLLAYGVLSGGIGFPLGMLFQAFGRFKVEPLANVAFFQELDHWTLMEQTFGYCMGAGAAMGVLRLARWNLTPAEEDQTNGWLSAYSVWAMLGLAPVLNLPTNFNKWIDLGLLSPETGGVSTRTILTCVLFGWLAIFGWTVVAQKRGAVNLLPSADKGRIQLLALAMMAVVLVLYLLLPSLRMPTALMFLGALAIGGLCVIHAGQMNQPPTPESSQSSESNVWKLGWKFWVMALLLPVFLIGLGYWTTSLAR